MLRDLIGKKIDIMSNRMNNVIRERNFRKNQNEMLPNTIRNKAMMSPFTTPFQHYAGSSN